MARKPLSDAYNLLACHPEIAKQWDYAANHPHRPENFTPGSNKVFFWICPQNPDHRWDASIYVRAAGHGCRYCAGKAAAEDNSIAGLHPKVAEEWHPTKNGDLTPDNVVAGSRKKRHWQCKLGHEWEATPLNRTYHQSGCPTCAKSGTSRIEIRVFTELFTLLNGIVDVDWREKAGDLECDIGMFDLGLAIEVDGYYWHDNKAEKDLAKREVLGMTGIRLIRLRDNRLEPLGHGDDVLFDPNATHEEVVGRLALKMADILRQKGHDRHADMLGRYVQRGKLVGDDLYANMVENMGWPPAGKSFADVAPDQAEAWDYEANGALRPTHFYPHSHYPAHWQCRECSHKWRVSIGSRTAGNGCPNCAGRAVTEKNNLVAVYPAAMLFWDGEVNDISPRTLLPSSTRMVHWRCPRGHQWQARVHAVANGAGCPECRLQANSLQTRFPNLAKEWHPTANGDLAPDQVNYGSKRLVWWRCANGHDWKAKINARSSGNNCPICAGKSVILETSLAYLHPDLAKQWVSSDVPGLTPQSVRPGSEKKAKWSCDRGHVWEATIRSRALGGTGCPTCQDPLADIDYETLPKTRAEALRFGSKFYFTGKPCQRHGHIAPRMTGNKNCRECGRIRSMDYYERKKVN